MVNGGDVHRARMRMMMMMMKLSTRSYLNLSIFTWEAAPRMPNRWEGSVHALVIHDY